MSYKVIRDAAGTVLAFGPNDEHYDPTIPQGFMLTIEASYPQIVKSYADKRKEEYPPMADYLDAVVKGDIAAQKAYIDACIAVKLKYPKA